MQQTPLTNEQFYMITSDADLENSGVLEFNEYMMVRWNSINVLRHVLRGILVCEREHGCSAVWPGRTCGHRRASA